VTAVYRVGGLRIHGVPVYILLAAAAACFVMAVVIFSLRDLRNWRSIAWLQIVTSVIGGVLSLLANGLPMSGTVGFVAAAFTAATGFKRLNEINESEQGQATDPASRS
jgi:hypothetical protein